MSKKDITILNGLLVLLIIFSNLYSVFQMPFDESIRTFGIFGGIARLIGIFSNLSPFMFCFVNLYYVYEKIYIVKFSKKYKYILQKYVNLIKGLAYVFGIWFIATQILGESDLLDIYFGKSLISKFWGITINILGIADFFKIKWISSQWSILEIIILGLLFIPIVQCLLNKNKRMVISISIPLSFVLIMYFYEDSFSIFCIILKAFVIVLTSALFFEFKIYNKLLDVFNNKSLACKRTFIIMFIIVISFYLCFSQSLILKIMSSVLFCIFGVMLIKKHDLKKRIIYRIGKYSFYMILINSFICKYILEVNNFSVKNIYFLYVIIAILTLTFSVCLKKIKLLMVSYDWDCFINSNKKIAILSLLLIIISYTVMLCTNPFAYHTNDDGAIQNTLSGNITGKPFPVHQFVNVLLSMPISFLYENIPNIQWWYVWSHLLLVCGVFILFFSIIKIATYNKISVSKVVLLLLIVSMCFIMYPIANISFTIIPGIFATGIIGMLFMKIYIKSSLVKIMIDISSLVGFVILLCHRGQSGKVLLCYILLSYLFYYLWTEKNKKRFITKYFSIALIFITTTLCVVTSNEAIQKYFNGEQFISYNEARAKYTDYPHDKYADNPKIYEDVGWSYLTYRLVNCWCFMDENVTAESFEKVSRENQTKIVDYKKLIESILHDEKCQPMLFFSVVCLIYFLCILRKRIPKNIIICVLFNFIGTSILILYQILSGRILYRTIHIVLLPFLVINVFCMLLANSSTEKNTKKRIENGILVLFLICLILCSEHLIDKEKNNNVYWTIYKSNSVREYVVNHPNNVYISSPGISTTINPFENWGDRKVSNLMGWGGSTVHSKEYYERLQKNGLTEMTGDVFKNENVYFITLKNAMKNDSKDDLYTTFSIFYSWLKESKDAVGFMYIDSINDEFFVYKFIFKGEENNYTTYYDFVDGYTVEVIK